MEEDSLVEKRPTVFSTAVIWLAAAMSLLLLSNIGELDQNI